MSETVRQRAPRKDQQRNREALVAAAFEVFAERGIDAPLDAVAKRAGVSGATLYRHFPDRRALIQTVLLANLARHREILTEAMEMQTGWAGLRHYLTWLWEEQRRNVSYLSALREISAGENHEVDRLRVLTMQAFAELTRRAKAEGVVREDRSTEDLLLLIYLNEQLDGLPKDEALAASHRFLRLALTSLVTNPDDLELDEPAHVDPMRRNILHRLAGHPPGKLFT